MGARSRNKGARGERELAEKLGEWLPHLTIKRGIGQSRGGGAEVPDVTGLPGIHPEAKRQKRCNPRAALRQAIDDADAGAIPVAMTRDDGAEWLATMRLQDWAVMYEREQRWGQLRSYLLTQHAQGNDRIELADIQDLLLANTA